MDIASKTTEKSVEREKILEVKDVTKDYKMGEITLQVLKGVNFDLYAGEFIVVLGPSGSGKSTMLNIVGGIDRPTSGSILYQNKEIGNMNEKELTNYRKDAIGFVFQFYNLIPNLNAKENVQLSAELSKKPLDVNQLLEDVGLGDKGGHFPAQMSGGQQQRVAIARALAKNPDILLCDEPTGALDFNTGIQVLRLLKDFNKQYNKTVIIITHNAGIGDIGDRVFHVKDGLIDSIEVNKTPIEPEEVVW